MTNLLQFPHSYILILIKVTHAEFLLLLKGGAALDMNTTKPKPFRWMLDVIWLNLVSSDLLLSNCISTSLVLDDSCFVHASFIW